jgi:hypothetical protein
MTLLITVDKTHKPPVAFINVISKVIIISIAILSKVIICKVIISNVIIRTVIIGNAIVIFVIVWFKGKNKMTKRTSLLLRGIN